MNHVISTKQFLDKAILSDLFRLADEMERRDTQRQLQKTLDGRVLACIFYESSTRTRFSFESAMLKLGGTTITTENATQFSSVTKGETLHDTILVISQYADVIVLRHFEEGSAQLAANVSRVPVINAGDGTGEHPTQALLDLYTIQKELGTIDNKKIVLVGDLLYGRTIHSLLNLLAIYEGIELYLVAPEQLKLPQRYKDYLIEKKIQFHELTDLREVAHLADVIYMTRVQGERFANKHEYEELKSFYIVNKEITAILKQDSIIMHPLPRVSEISVEIDDDKRAAYFRQARNGLYIRMALLEKIVK